MAPFVHSFRCRGTDHIAKEYRILKRQKPHIFYSQPRVGSGIQANFTTTYSVYLLSDDPEMSQLIFIFLIIWIISLIYLSILYIYLIHLLILFFCFFYFPPSAVCFLTLQTPKICPTILLTYLLTGGKDASAKTRPSGLTGVIWCTVKVMLHGTIRNDEF